MNQSSEAIRHAKKRAPAASVADAKVWFYLDKSRINGPCSIDDLGHLVRNGVIQFSTLICHREMDGWLSVSETPELNSNAFRALAIEASGAWENCDFGERDATPVIRIPLIMFFVNTAIFAGYFFFRRQLIRFDQSPFAPDLVFTVLLALENALLGYLTFTRLKSIQVSKRAKKLLWFSGCSLMLFMLVIAVVFTLSG